LLVLFYSSVPVSDAQYSVAECIEDAADTHVATTNVVVLLARPIEPPREIVAKKNGTQYSEEFRSPLPLYDHAPSCVAQTHDGCRSCVLPLVGFLARAHHDAIATLVPIWK